MKYALCQINPLVADLPGNFRKIRDFLARAKQGGAEIALFPELALFGYPPLDLVLSEELLLLCEKYLHKLTEEASIPFIVGLPTLCKNGIKRAYNSSAFFDGEKLHITHKQLLPTYDVFDEARVFSPGPPTKPIVWKGKKLGILICEDGWQCGKFCPESRYGIDPTDQLKGVDFVISLNASPYRRGIIQKRQDVFSTVAKKLNAPVIAICQVGANDGLIFDGSSFVAYSDGSTSQIAKSFEEDLVFFELENQSKVQNIFLYSKTHELEQALLLGIRDYFHKQNFQKAILGLSGGVDSAVALVLLTKALGASNVKTLYLPTEFNSSQSEEDALDVARKMGVDFAIIPIQTLFKEFHQALKLSSSLTLENLQARIRSLILMSFANQEGRLMINTSNKSELSMGYSTIYGDLAGAISPLGDLWKEEVYELARLYVGEGILHQSLIEKAPSAELRANQKDEDTLPPYPKLDPVLQEIIQENLDSQTIRQKTKEPLQFLHDVLLQFDRSEYKRKQGPLILKVSSKDLQTGRVFPIVQKRVLSLFPIPGENRKDVFEI